MCIKYYNCCVRKCMRCFYVRNLVRFVILVLYLLWFYFFIIRFINFILFDFVIDVCVLFLFLSLSGFVIYDVYLIWCLKWDKFEKDFWRNFIVLIFLKVWMIELLIFFLKSVNYYIYVFIFLLVFILLY